MLSFKLIHSDNIPKGFWLTFLWIFAIGLKNETDNHGAFIMFTLAIWRLQAHFTLALDNK